MNEGMNEGRKDWKLERLKDWKTEWMNGWMNEWKIRVNIAKNEGLKNWKTEWMSGTKWVERNECNGKAGCNNKHWNNRVIEY